MKIKLLFLSIICFNLYAVDNNNIFPRGSYESCASIEASLYNNMVGSINNIKNVQNSINECTSGDSYYWNTHITKKVTIWTLQGLLFVGTLGIICSADSNCKNGEKPYFIDIDNTFEYSGEQYRLQYFKNIQDLNIQLNKIKSVMVTNNYNECIMNNIQLENDYNQAMNNYRESLVDYNIRVSQYNKEVKLYAKQQNQIKYLTKKNANNCKARVKHVLYPSMARTTELMRCDLEAPLYTEMDYKDRISNPMNPDKPEVPAKPKIDICNNQAD
jgi:hypothetical protein